MSKDAQRFYVDHVKRYSNWFENSVELIDVGYNYVVWQNRVKIYLRNLRVVDYIEENTDAAAAIAKVYTAILKLSRQVPVSQRGDLHRVEFLSRAVIGLP